VECSAGKRECERKASGSYPVWGRSGRGDQGGYGFRNNIPVIMMEKICNPEPDMYIIIAFIGILPSTQVLQRNTKLEITKTWMTEGRHAYDRGTEG